MHSKQFDKIVERLIHENLSKTIGGAKMCGLTGTPSTLKAGVIARRTAAFKLLTANPSVRQADVIRAIKAQFGHSISVKWLRKARGLVRRFDNTLGTRRRKPQIENEPASGEPPWEPVDVKSFAFATRPDTELDVLRRIVELLTPVAEKDPRAGFRIIGYLHGRFRTNQERTTTRTNTGGGENVIR